MINKYGRNLNILIVTEVGEDWRAYASWYSIYKNLPEAHVRIACIRNKEMPFQLFQWAKRLKIPLFYVNPMGLTPLVEQINCVQIASQDNILAINDRILALDVIDPDTLDLLNHSDTSVDPQHNVQFLKHQNAKELLNQILLNDKTPYNQTLCLEAKEAEKLVCLASCRKGCGKWIDTLKGCPFSNAAGLASTEMTVNENRIIELWKKMCSMYSAIA